MAVAEEGDGMAIQTRKPHRENLAMLAQLVAQLAQLAATAGVADLTIAKEGQGASGGTADFVRAAAMARLPVQVLVVGVPELAELRARAGVEHVARPCNVAQSPRHTRHMDISVELVPVSPLGQPASDVGSTYIPL